MNELLKQTSLFVLHILVQVLLVSLLAVPELYAWPKLFPLYVLLLPFYLPRLAELLLVFTFGLMLDWAMQTPPGGSSFGLLSLVLLRRYWVGLISRQSNWEFLKELRFSRQGLGWLLSYLLPLLFVYELIYYVVIDFGIDGYTLAKILGSGLASMLWAGVGVVLFFRKSKAD